MQSLTIDLKKNPEVERLVSAMEPGGKVDLHCSIRARDEQTLTLTLEEASEGADDAGGTEEDDAPAESGE